MNQFKKLTVEELMKLLIDLTKDNEKQIGEFNQSVSLLSKSGKPYNEIREKINHFYNLIQESIGENKKFVTLFRALIDFNKYFNEHLEFSIEEEADNNALDELDSLSKEIGDSIVEEEIEDFDANLESKSLEELQKVLEQYILEEKYEECSKIKLLIEKGTS